MRFDKNSLYFIGFLGALSALPPLSIDMALPALPEIEQTFSNAEGRSALTLGLFLGGFSVSPLLAGPLSDSLGRRKTLACALLLFSICALINGFTRSFQTLLLFRICQGIAAGGCVVLPFAIVRDIYEGSIARHRMSQITTALGIAPMVAPVLGSLILSVGSWRYIYFSQALLGIVLLITTILKFTETVPQERQHSFDLMSLARNYRTVLSDKTFRYYGSIYSIAFSCMFAFISASSAVLMGELGLNKITFALVFALTSCGMAIGSATNTYLLRHHVSSQVILRGSLTVMFVGAAVARGCYVFFCVSVAEQMDEYCTQTLSV